jgi:outer membrane protein
MGLEVGRFAVVDLQRCIKESIEGKKVFEKLKGEKDAMQKKLDIKQNELVKLKEELDKQSMMLSVDAQEDKAKDFQRKQRDFKYLYEDLTQELRKAEAEERRRLIKELERVVLDIGKKENYLFVFERRSSGIMYMDNVIDITDKVIEAYDQTKK